MTPDRTRELIEGYLDGALDEAGLAEFDRALAADPAFARAFAAACADDAILRELVAGAGARANKQPGEVPSLAEATRRRAHTARLHSRPERHSWIPFAAAAAVLLTAAAFVLSRSSSERLPGSDNRPTVDQAARHTPDRRGVAEPPMPSNPVPAPVPRVETVQAPAPTHSPEPVTPTPSSAPVAVVPSPETAPPPAPVETPPVTPPDPKVVTAPPPVAPDAPPSTATEVAIAVLRELRGRVEVVTPSGRVKAVPGQELRAGEGLETGDREASAVAALPDGTSLRLSAGGRMRGIVAGDSSGGGAETRILLDRGTMFADVTHQAAGRSIVFVTPHAEARVLGTRLTLSVTDKASRLDVEQGRVRLTRTRDGASVEVPAGMYAASEPDGELRLRSTQELTLSFQEGVAPTPRYEGARDAEIQGATGKTRTNSGRSAKLLVDGTSPDQDGDRYGLFRWDLSAVPPGSTILQVDIRFFVLNAPHGSPYEFYALLQPWDEAETTWLLRSSKQPWQKPGAAGEQDRAAEILGSVAPAGLGSYSCSLNAAGVRCVQEWINQPQSNLGMILANPRNTDALGVATREARDPSQRPRLTVVFTPPGPNSRPR